MDGAATYETQRIDHLGIVAGVCQEISLIEQIDQQVRSSERKVSCGQGAQAMILNALGFVGRALYLTPGCLENKPVDVLIGEDVCAADFNDDTLARCLDDLYEAGVTEVFYRVAGHALQVYGITSQYGSRQASTYMSRITVGTTRIGGQNIVAVNGGAPADVIRILENWYPDRFITSMGNVHVERFLYETAVRYSTSTGLPMSEVIQAIGIANVGGSCSLCLPIANEIPIFFLGRLLPYLL